MTVPDYHRKMEKYRNAKKREFNANKFLKDMENIKDKIEMIRKQK